MRSNFFCDGINRRDFLKVGALTGVGLTLSRYLAMAQAGEITPAKGKAAIFVRLAGGPSHLDTFDLKPDAPSEYRGNSSRSPPTSMACRSASTCLASPSAPTNTLCCAA